MQGEPPRKRYHIGGTIKIVIFRDVKSGKCMISTPQELANYVDEKIIRDTTLYIYRKKKYSASQKKQSSNPQNHSPYQQGKNPLNLVFQSCNTWRTVL